MELDDKDKTLILLSSLHESFEPLNNALIYGKYGTIKLEEVQSVIINWELTKMKDLKVDDSSEGLNVSRVLISKS